MVHDKQRRVEVGFPSNMMYTLMERRITRTKKNSYDPISNRLIPFF